MRKALSALGFVSAGALLILLTLWAFAPSDPPGAGGLSTEVNPHQVYNPVAAGEALPDGFRQLLPRDGIQPIYDPQFTSAAGVEWPDETQVIGVAAGDEAKAYPVSFLDRHEMVNDFIAGDPILVTW